MWQFNLLLAGIFCLPSLIFPVGRRKVIANLSCFLCLEASSFWQFWVRRDIILQGEFLDWNLHIAILFGLLANLFLLYKVDDLVRRASEQAVLHQ